MGILSHLASHQLSTLGERENEESESEESENEESESEESECEESESEEGDEKEFQLLAKSHLVAQELGIMHQVSYSSSVSTFCQNEIKDRNYNSA